MMLALLLYPHQSFQVIACPLWKSCTFVNAWAASTSGERRGELIASGEKYRTLEASENIGSVAVFHNGFAEAVALVKEKDDGTFVLLDVACNQYAAGTRLVTACMKLPNVHTDASLDSRWKVTAANTGFYHHP